MAPPCKVCFSTEEDSYLEIFDDKHGEKQIAQLISKYLWFEVQPTEGQQHLCGKCWTSLSEFHRFYQSIEHVHKFHSVSDTELSENTSNDVVLKTEILFIKPEPVDYEEENDDFDEPFPEVDVKVESDQIGSGSEGHQKHEIQPSVQHVNRKKVTVKKDSKLPKTKTPRGEEVDTELLEFYQRLICEICDLERMARGEPTIEYSSLRELNKHTKSVHNVTKFVYIKCPVCEKKMQYRVHLLQHKDMHLNPDKYRCTICSEIHQNMEEHMKIKHQERTFCCDLCESKFPTKERLRAHMRKLHTEKDVICDICQKAFTKYAIDDHKRAVHNTQFVCEHCPKTFKVRFKLNEHMEEHDASLRKSTVVTCHICGQVLRHKYNLKQHIKQMHTEQKPVDCSSCGKTFKSKRCLIAHRSSTCTDRTFPCMVCGKPFKRKFKLKEHMTTHTGKALYMCSFCPATFNQNTHLYYHRKQVHYEQWLIMQQQRKQGVRFKLQEIG